MLAQTVANFMVSLSQALVGFLLDESDSTTIHTAPCENGEGEEEGQAKTLDNPEWVAAFTGGRCNLETFQVG